MASLDPLDRELFQRAFDAACSAVKADELDSDEKPEAALRCELSNRCAATKSPGIRAASDSL